jgi:hypothetical protein
MELMTPAAKAAATIITSGKSLESNTGSAGGRSYDQIDV